MSPARSSDASNDERAFRAGASRIETWQLLDTRTLPSECARLPLSTIFADPDQGATPAALIDNDDTLETPVGEITRENEIARNTSTSRSPPSARRPRTGSRAGAEGEGALPQGRRPTREGRHGR